MSQRCYYFSINTSPPSASPSSATASSSFLFSSLFSPTSEFPLMNRGRLVSELSLFLFRIYILWWGSIEVKYLFVSWLLVCVFRFLWVVVCLRASGGLGAWVHVGPLGLLGLADRIIEFCAQFCKLRKNKLWNLCSFLRVTKKTAKQN